MSMNANTQTLIVRRDGQLDLDWLEDIEAIERREAFRRAGQTILNELIQLPNRVGRLTLNVLTHLEEHNT